MLVEFVELRAGEIKLSKREIEETPKRRGKLFITGGDAYLVSGENPHLGQLVLPLRRCDVYKVDGDVIMIRGYQARSEWKPDDPLPQVWACRVISSQ